MAWKLKGTYFENCSCDGACPCTYSCFISPVTSERCQAVLVYHVRAGEVDGIDVGGLSIAVVADTPGQLTDGNWRLGLIVDAAASDEQADKLTAIFSGQAGGPMAALVTLVGEVIGIERAPIDYRDNGHTHSAKVGDGIEIEIEDFADHEGLEPTRLVDVSHPSNTTLTIAKPTSSRIRAFGMEFQNEGRSAFSAPFSWAG